MDQSIIDLLSSDVRIVDSTSRTADPERGVQTLRFPGHLMPDGKDYVGEVPGRLDPSILRGWCNAVRGEFDARSSRQDSKEVRDAGVRAEGGGGGNLRPGEQVPVDERTQGNGAESEASLDEYLQAEVAKWARLKQRATETITDLGTRIDAAVAKHDEYTGHLLKAQKVLAFYLNQTDEELPF